MKTTLSVLSLAVALTIAAPAHSGGGGLGGGATEVTQLLNNAELAIQTIQEEMTFIQTQMNTYYSMLQQLPTTVLDAAGLGGLAGQIQTLKGTYDSLNRLAGSVANLKSAADYRFREFAASGLDWNSWVNREMNSITYRKDMLGMVSQRERDIIDQVQRNYEQVQAYQAKLGTTTGTHSAMQVMNAQMNSLLAVTNDILQYQALKGATDTAKAEEENALRQRTLDEERARRAAQEKINQRNRALLDGAAWKGK